MIITSQNWDGVTAPALPTGWTYTSGFATSASEPSPVSSPNVLTFAGNGLGTATFGTPDSSSGNVRVTADFTSAIPSGSGGSAAQGTLYARQAAGSPTSGYAAMIDFYAGSVSLLEGPTTLATVGASLIGAYASAEGSWFTLQLICDGSTIAVNLQRMADGYWLQTNGTWGATKVNCLSVTNTAVAGSGYAGIGLDCGFAEYPGDVYTDNFLFESLLDARPQAIVVPARYVWQLYE